MRLQYSAVGAFSDYAHVPYDSGDITTLYGYTRTGYYHVHGASFLLPKYAQPVTLTSAAGGGASNQSSGGDSSSSGTDFIRHNEGKTLIVLTNNSGKETEVTYTQIFYEI